MTSHFRWCKSDIWLYDPSVGLFTFLDIFSTTCLYENAVETHKHADQTRKIYKTVDIFRINDQKARKTFWLSSRLKSALFFRRQYFVLESFNKPFFSYKRCWIPATSDPLLIAFSTHSFVYILDFRVIGKFRRSIVALTCIHADYSQEALIWLWGCIGQVVTITASRFS